MSVPSHSVRCTMRFPARFFFFLPHPAVHNASQPLSFPSWRLPHRWHDAHAAGRAWQRVCCALHHPPAQRRRPRPGHLPPRAAARPRAGAVPVCNCACGASVVAPRALRRPAPAAVLPCLASSHAAWQGDNSAVTDVEILNAFNGVSAVGAGRHYIARIQGQPLNIGIYIDQTYDVCPDLGWPWPPLTRGWQVKRQVKMDGSGRSPRPCCPLATQIGRLEDVHFNPWFSDNLDFMYWQTTFGRAFVMGRSDWECTSPACRVRPRPEARCESASRAMLFLPRRLQHLCVCLRLRLPLY